MCKSVSSTNCNRGCCRCQSSTCGRVTVPWEGKRGSCGVVLSNKKLPRRNGGGGLPPKNIYGVGSGKQREGAVLARGAPAPRQKGKHRKHRLRKKFNPPPPHNT